MRFEPVRRPQEGDTRNRAGFLWFPKTAKYKTGNRETRWLEYAHWEEAYLFWDDESEYESDDGWIPTYWLEE